MAYPPGFLFPPPPPLSSCPSVVLGSRAGHEGSAFAPYSASGPHAPYGAEPRAASAISSFLSPGFESSTALDFHPFAPLGPCHPYADPAYRKNATRDATATLKAWLNEHRKNPYPTKGEKIMLAIITKMTLTQVSTWFANARRRLKKENKMTWTPRNRSEDEEEPEELEPDRPDEYEQALRQDHHQGETAPASSGPWLTSDPTSSSSSSSSDCTPHCSPEPPHSLQTQQRPLPLTTTTPPPPPPLPPRLSPPPPPPAPDPPAKPKLWSLAEIATSSDTKPAQDHPRPTTPTQRTSYAHGSGLSRALYFSPAYIYHYSPVTPTLPLNGLYSRPERDFGLRNFGAEKQDHQLLVPL